MELTSFVGRRDELATLRRALEGHRAVTVTGTGGVGKTRLAVHAAGESARAFEDGVWFVELDEVADEVLVSATVLTGLGLRDDGGTSAETRLIEHFQPKQALLLLDGCDRVVEACARLVDRLLKAAPGLRVLSTSRRPLRIGGEAVLPIAPLSAPAAGEPLGHSAAVSLFVDRAKATRPGFTLAGDNAQLVVQVCGRLDGLPMAIELAAGRLDVLSLEELAERLEDAYRILVAGKRGAPPRQQTLRALVDSSFALCTPDERVLWARLAVFTGRFDLGAIEQVCTEAIDGDVVLELVAGLVDKSVLTREEHPGGSWYRLRRLLRDYGLERLVEAGETDELRARHARWCVWLADHAMEALLSREPRAWMARVRGNHANIRAALEHSLGDSGQAREGLRIASSLWFYWIMVGRIGEGRAWLRRGLRISKEPSVERAWALAVAAYLAVFDDGIDDSAAMLDEASALSRRLEAPAVGGYVAFVEGLIEVHLGESASARARFEQGLEILRGAGNLMGVSETLFLLATTSALEGDPDRALDYCQQYLRLVDASGDNWGRAYILWSVALARWREGTDPVAALTAQRNSVELFRRFDDRFGLGWCVQTGALLFTASGQHREAALLLGAAETHRIPAFRVLDDVHDRCVHAVRAPLGDRRFRELVEQGSSLSLDEAVDLIAPRSGITSVAVSGEPDLPDLSKREREVAGLVAEGQSNKDIAAALVISPRTAEGHVQRILVKLGFESRTQIAAWMVEQRVTH